MTDVVFESPHEFDEHRVLAAAVYCSDGRWGENFDDFEYDFLELRGCDRFAIPGGPATLAQVGTPEAEVARAQLALLIEVHQLTQVVLIQHDDCAYYLQRLAVEPSQLRVRQADDLRRAAQTLRGMKDGLRVSAYMAVRVGPEGKKVVFEAVPV